MRPARRRSTSPRGLSAMRAVLASQNPHKLEELRAALPGWEIEPLVADGWPEETGETYDENALLKARFGRERGAGRRGCSARTRGSSATRSAARRACTRRAGRRAAIRRTRCSSGSAASRTARARMVTELVALSPDGEELRGRGVLEGAIARERRGDGRLRLRPDLRPGRRRRGPSPSSATTGSASTRIAPRRRRVARSAAVESTPRAVAR